MKYCKNVWFVIVAVAVLVASSQAWATTISPLTLTGYNRDILWGPDGGQGGGYAEKICSPQVDANVAYYLTGTMDKNGQVKTNGLPTGNFTSAANADHTYCLAPAGGDIRTPNALMVYPGATTGSGTLVLTTPGYYDTIGVLASSAAGGGTYSFTLNYRDGTKASYNYYAGDAYSGSGTTAVTFYRGEGASEVSIDGFYVASSLTFKFFETTVSANPSKVLESLTFSGASSGDTSTVIVAVSGHGEPVPEPSTIVLLASGLVGLAAYAWRKRK
jgi:hypothetical protein